MNYDAVARDILTLAGGPGNVENLTHCFTRLRFELSDRTKADKEKLAQVEGVVSVVERGGQIQVVIGTKVEHVYEAVCRQMEARKTSSERASAGEISAGKTSAGKISAGKTPAANKDIQAGARQGTSVWNRILISISAMFTPMVPAIAASGLLKGFLTIARITASGRGVDITGNDTYIILMAATDAIFYFMPIILAYTSAKVFHANEFVAMALGGTMCYPAILELMTGGAAVRMFGVALTKANYTSSVIPIIIGVFILSYVERFLTRVIPEILKIILVPGISLLVMVPAVYLVFGPVGIYIGNAINYVYTGMMALSPALCGAFIGGMWCVFVIFGAHRALVPIGINDVARFGRQNLLAFAGAANFSQGGAALGVMLRTKDRNLKAIAASASLTAGVCGITEPAIYGCNLRLKKPMVCAVICGAAGGAVMGIGGVYGDAFANNGVLTLATYGAFGMRNFLFYLLGISISFFGSALLTWVFGFEELDEGENRG